MSFVNPVNERVKHRYQRWLKEAERLSAATIDHALTAIYHFEQFTKGADFKCWSLDQVLDYKVVLRRQGNSAATFVTKVRALQRFFHWLADQPAYRRVITHDLVNYLNPSNEELALAHAYRRKDSATLSEAQKVIRSMPSSTDVELRDRAILACAFLTGARVSALRTLKLKHLLPDGSGIFQDAKEVKIKFAKTQVTTFFPVGEDIRRAFVDYADHLRLKLNWEPDDPLFPSTEQRTGDDGVFRVVGLSRSHWKTPDPIRKRFKHAFEAAGVPYYSPHRARNSLTTLGMQLCKSAEEFKAWSENSGHESVTTTLRSYGEVGPERAAEILTQMSRPKPDQDQAAALGQALLGNPEIAQALRDALIISKE